MEQFQIVYDANKTLDIIFDELYDSSKPEIILKNIVGLLVELGELANETKIFKYWTKKQPSPKEIILEEYADCFILVLTLFNEKNLDLKEIELSEEKNSVLALKKLYYLVSSLDITLDDNLLKTVMGNLLNFAYLLGYNDQDIINSCLAKIEKNKRRFGDDFKN